MLDLDNVPRPLMILLLRSQTSTGNVVGPPHTVLQQIQIVFASSQQCKVNASSPADITERTICAGDPTGGKNDCKGDGGSPLVVGTRGSLGISINYSSFDGSLNIRIN